jgi:hypothetical protein
VSYVSYKPRWGRVREIGATVGSAAWQAYPGRLKHLSAWRYAHLLGDHDSIRRYARRNDVAPTSDLHIRGPVSKLDYLRRKGGLS